MKIVSLAPSNTEILFALGMGRNIAGVTRFCDYPADARYKPKVGGWLDVKTDYLKELKPDLVFTSSFLQAEIVERLNRNGMSVVHVDPRTLDDVYESIITIGEAVGRAERAEGLVAEMKRRLSKVKESSLRKRKIRAYCEEWHRPA
jgi:iron complex transport system substrate-binding protein